VPALDIEINRSRLTISNPEGFIDTVPGATYEMFNEGEIIFKTGILVIFIL